MTVRHKRSLIAAIAIGVAAVLSFFILAPESGFDFFTRTVALHGHTPPVVGQAELVGKADPNEKQQVIIGLELRNEAELDKLIAEQADPNSPNYGKYITPDEFNQRFAPEQKDVDAVVDYLKSKGLTVVSVSSNRTLITVEGTVEQFEDAFTVKINHYRLARAGAAGGAVEFNSNASDPRIPAHLKSIVHSVIGLNTAAQFESRMVKTPPQPGSHMRTPQPNAAPYGMGPKDAASVYNFPNANNKNATVKYTGAGRVVAIATAYSYNQSDVDDYWKQYGIQRTGAITNIHINGVSNQANEETTLDLQQLGAQAPGAEILMYMGVDPKFTTFTMVFNQIVVDNKADVMSVSWGLCERWTGSRQMATEHKIFKQAAAQGIVIFAASGDDGAYDCRGDKNVDYEVDYPSSDPHVTAVGGTTLRYHNGKRTSEEAWTGSGGGKSEEYKRPSWQTGPGVPTTDERHSADVSMNADPWTGYAILFDGEWITSGGTSISAPNWAALWTLSSEAAGKRIGSGNARIYRMGSSADYAKLFFDVVKGDNGDHRGPGYPAGPNWDHPTGWGTPNGTAILEWLVTDTAAKVPQAPADPADAPETVDSPSR